MKPFPIARNTMVVTSTFVTEQGMPILEVSHEDDEEGGCLWQFHCGNGDYSMSRMQLVRLDTILALDPTIEQLAELKMGSTARRESLDSAWILGE